MVVLLKHERVSVVLFMNVSMCIVQRHRCDLFSACNFIIKYGGATRTWMHRGIIVHERANAYIP
jgi:hypothetical protein